MHVVHQQICAGDERSWHSCIVEILVLMLSINGVQIALANGEDVWNCYRRSRFFRLYFGFPPNQGCHSPPGWRMTQHPNLKNFHLQRGSPACFGGAKFAFPKYTGDYIPKLLGMRKWLLDGCAGMRFSRNQFLMWIFQQAITHRFHGTGMFTYMNGWFFMW